nr:hypothetical protein BaRGS_026228 [Batillaria attramentaria]
MTVHGVPPAQNAATIATGPRGRGYYPALVAMATVCMAAVVGNVCNILVIAKCAHLRHALSNFFVVSLCTSDLLAATLVMPMAAAAFALGHWPFGETACDALGFLSSLLMFVSMTTLCVISVERFYSIKLPMHHAAHMSFVKTLCVVLLVWIWAAFLAALPLFGIGSYAFRHHRYHCSFTWKEGSANEAYVVIVATLCFVVPGLVLLAMYVGIFRVAKDAATKVCPVSGASLHRVGGTLGSFAPAGVVTGQYPVVTVPGVPASPRAPVPTIAASNGSVPGCRTITMPTTTLQACSEAPPVVTDSVRTFPSGENGLVTLPSQTLPSSQETAHNPIIITVNNTSREGPGQPAIVTASFTEAGASKYVSTNCTSGPGEGGSSHGTGSRGSDSSVLVSTDVSDVSTPRFSVNTLKPLRGHLKAAKTLLILMAAYTLLWGPFFVLHVHGVINEQFEAKETTEMVALWLGFGSFAVNPFLYGWMNKAIREELISLYRRLFCSWCCCKRCGDQAEEDDLLGPPDEDFFQFLERTRQACARKPSRSCPLTGQMEKEGVFEASEINAESSGPF